MSKFVKDTDLGYGEFSQTMRDIARSGPFVKVGILGGSNSEVATYAGANEFGVPSKNIPERSWIRSTMDKIGFALFKKSEEALDRIARGKSSPVRELNIIGLFVKDRMVKTIETLREPPNAAATIAQKQGVDNPLIDEGRMRNAVDFVVIE